MTLKIGITCYPTVGGSGVVATELGKLLAEKGHEIHFITTSLPFRLNKTYENVYFHEVEVNQYDVFQYPPYSLTLASKMTEVVKKEDLDILHVHYAVPHAACAVLAKDMAKDRNVKVVTTLHGTDITVLGHDPSLREIIRYAIHRSDKVTAVSYALAQETKQMLHTENRIETIYNFIDERIYHPHGEKDALKEEYGIRREDKLAIHISNFRPVKRVTDVIYAFATLLEHVPNTHLIMVGDGPDREKAKSEVKHLGIEERVLFVGNQKDIASLIRMSDVMFLLSEKESFGLVALEAMACGVPVIGTNAGGIPEVVVDGKTGFICPIGQPEVAGKKASELLLNQKTYELFSEQAMLRVEDKFASSTIVEQYEKVYEEVLAERSVRDVT
ncbi:N-acetyl-alpha-D-glucosaminyl L-malate synthase BshA [Aliibacillus thermotolerans]|uniref:N-acetyl-alpha-D-glucosaminyl L-malate synthase BshA n=1 Tax=Aliibacillus thermotolerans TaxID=1834418 RepID=A0ABW0U6A0_9BACI|nr:N-acetyl-alpha-D-glucosaminyl L-malate synthase BshA [Aliibacillus thermotolerans]MDA3130170.1 N-acetyl-alpha-D-glucosaminyl L-malate synthase BshA [Aliibacillus thermotolerans]